MATLSRNARTSPRPAQAPWGWALVGLLLGSVLAVLLFAPAHWLAAGVRQATSGQVELADPRGTVVALEQAGQFLRRDAGTGVVHGDAHAPTVLRQRDADLAAGRRVAQRVVHQLVDQALDQRDVGAHLRQRSRARTGQAQLAAFGFGRVLLQQVLHQLGRRQRLGVGAHVLGFQPCQVEQVHHQARQALALARRGLQVVARLGRRQPLVLQQQQLEVALQRCQRRAQVVRQVGQQLARRT